MRPISLTLEGFTCFKQRQTLSFEGLDLFAIWGPTGAGKTSLLDAMVFALYGGVPRLGEHRNRDVISLTRDKAVVLFEFSAGPARYRVLRSVRRKGASEAKLEDAEGNVLADGVHSVDDAIVKLLGLSYNAFVQAVMLPQGEFARFLKSEPKARREILRDLLRLKVYEEMRKAAEERRRALEAQYEQASAVLEQYEDATPERLAALEARLPEARRHAQAAHAAVDVANDRLREGLVLAKAAAELRQHRETLAALERDAARINAVRDQIDAADRAAAVMPEIRTARDAATAAAADRAEAERARAAVGTERARCASAAGALAAAVQEADQVAALRARISALDGIRGVVAAREGVCRRLEAAEAALCAAQEHAKTTEQAVSAQRTVLVEVSRKVEQVARAFDESTYDRALDDAARRLLSRATELQAARRAAGAALAAQRQADSARTKAERTLGDAAGALSAARERRAAAEASLADADAAEREGHNRESAAVLRRTLRPGEPCPVCTRPVGVVPPVLATPKLDVLARQLASARRAASDAAEADRRAAIAHATAEAGAITCRGDAEAAAAACRMTEAVLEGLDGRLVADAGPEFDREDGACCEERILAAAARLDGLRGAHERVAEQLAGLSHERDLAAVAVDGKTRELAQVQERCEREERTVAEAKTELADLQAAIAAVTSRPDPAAEAIELSERVDALCSSLDEAKTADAAARSAFASAQAVATTAEAHAVTAAAAATAAARKANAAAKRGGFDTTDAAQAAAVEPAALAALRTSVSEYEFARGTAQAQLTALVAQLGGRDVSEDGVRALHAELRAARGAHEAAVRAVATLEEQVAQTRRRSETRARHAAEVTRLGAELMLYRLLADELRTDRFQEFLLEEAFHELARGGSQRLHELTGRYSLRYREGALLIVDHDNGDEERSTDTLSGGETFLASLALALQLSEQIQQAAGAVLLEALFVDEGFGTLDAETLESAETAIQALHGNGRMVGIITHLRELADRLPYRIMVHRQAEGSRLEVQVS